jgi:hypothetical protein
MKFEYRTEPVRQALVLTAVCVLAALLINLPLIQVSLLAAAAGPAVWMLIQVLRRGHGLQVCDDHLLIQNPLLRRARRIQYSAVCGYAATRSGGLAVAYEKPPRPPQGQVDSKPLALTDLRPESYTTRPRYGLAVTSPLYHTDNLIASLAERMGNRPASDQPFSADDIMAWARRKRVRNFILIVLAVLGTPLYVIIAGRIIASFLSYGAVNVTR